MKKKVLSMILALTMFTVIIPNNTAFADTNSFVDAYDYEDLESSSISYDFDKDGIMDTLQANLYANYWAFNSMIINGQKILFDISRHGRYVKLYVTDIDASDNFLDIITINSYKGLSAGIYRYDGKNLLKSNGFYNVSSNRDPEGYIDGIEIKAGGGNITFICNGETSEYKNVSEFERVNLGDNYTAAFDAYKNILSNTSFGKYTLYDIDHDKTPELIVSNYGDGGFSDCQIYSYGENGLSKIADDTIHYGIYRSSWGGILFKTGGTGVTAYIRKFLNNGNLEEDSQTFLSACYTDGYENFVFEGKQVSEKEYKSNEPTEADELKFTPKNDLSALRDMLYQPKSEIKVVLNGSEIRFDQPPIMAEDRILVPIRKIAEAMGDTVLWNDAYQTAFIKHGDRGLIIKLLEDHIKIAENENWTQWQKKELDVKAFSANGRTLVPVRAFCESLGADVKWVGEEGTAYITYDFKNKAKEMSAETFRNINTVYYALNNLPEQFKEFSSDFNEFYDKRNPKIDATAMGVSDIWSGIKDLVSGLPNDVNVMKSSIEEMLTYIPDNDLVIVDTDMLDDIKDGLMLTKERYDIRSGINDEFLKSHADLKSLNTSIKAAEIAYDAASFSAEQLAVFFSDYQKNIQYLNVLKSVIAKNGISDDKIDAALSVLEKEYADKYFQVMLNTRDELTEFTIKEGVDLATGGLFRFGVYAWEQAFKITGATQKGQSLKTFYGLFCIDGTLNNVYKAAYDGILSGNYTADDVSELNKLDDIQRALKITVYNSIKNITGDAATQEYCAETAKKLSGSCMLWKAE